VSNNILYREDGTEEFLPSENQVRFVAALFCDNVRGIKSLAAKETGINASCFNTWWHDLGFRKWYSAKCDEHLLVGETIAAGQLMEKVAAGDLRAIAIFYELVGKLRNPVREQTQTNVINIYNLWKAVKKDDQQDACNIADTVGEAAYPDTVRAPGIPESTPRPAIGCADAGGDPPAVPA